MEKGFSRVWRWSATSAKNAFCETMQTYWCCDHNDNNCKSNLIPRFPSQRSELWMDLCRVHDFKPVKYGKGMKEVQWFILGHYYKATCHQIRKETWSIFCTNVEMKPFKKTFQLQVTVWTEVQICTNINITSHRFRWDTWWVERTSEICQANQRLP